MMEQLRKLADLIITWIDGQTMRNRIWLTIGGVLIIFFGIYFLFVAPSSSQREQLKSRIQTTNESIAKLEEQINEIIEDASKDTLSETKGKHSKLTKRLALLQQQLSSLKTENIAADQMVGLLTNILKREQGLRLVSLSNSPPKSITQETKEGSDPIY